MRLWRPSRKSFFVVRFDRERTSSHLFYQLSSDRLIRRLYIWIRRRHLLFHQLLFHLVSFFDFLSKFPPLFLLGLFFGFFFVSTIFLVFQWLSDCICFWPELFTCSIRLPLRGLIIFESSTLLLSLYNVLGSSSLMSIILQSILPWRSSSNQTNVCKCYVSE